MSTSIGYSSELYFIEPQDIIKLKNTPQKAAAKIKCADDVVVLLGDKKTNTFDTLVCGRNIAKKAISENTSHIPVRFVFISNIAKWNILPIFFKQLRQYFKFESKVSYHTTLTHLRNLHIERGFRNAENAYVISKKWNIGPEERVRKYNKLVNSLKKKGFDDKQPISIMLNRRCGIKDCVDDGHHRIGICAENNIERIAIRFRAAGTLPKFLQKFGLKFINMFPKLPN